MRVERKQEMGSLRLTAAMTARGERQLRCFLPVNSGKREREGER